MLPALPDEVQPGEGPGLLPLGQPLGLTSSAHSEAAGLGDGFIYPDLTLKPGSRPPAEGPWERIWDHSQTARGCCGEGSDGWQAGQVPL